MKMARWLGIFMMVFVTAHHASCTLMTQPEQVHLSYGASPDQMMVTWVTMDPTNASLVEYGVRRLTSQTNGTSSVFVDGGDEKRSIFVHRVLLHGLQPGQTYVYHCGSRDGWSSLFWFKAMDVSATYSPMFAVYGDLGNVNAQSLPRLQEEVQRGVYDAVLHVGDFAYDMDTDNARVGDEFMRQLEPIAAYVPYMTCVGNHEQKYVDKRSACQQTYDIPSICCAVFVLCWMYLVRGHNIRLPTVHFGHSNFSNYNNRFSMINLQGDINNHFFSFNIGPAHIISFSTEFYYYIEYGLHQIVNQYHWLEQDLTEANKPENRAQRPWIITMAHRPMYCSTTDMCLVKMDIFRKGLPLIHTFGLEELFYKHGVDLEIWAHEHIYERMWPIYDIQVYNGSTEAPYTNPKAPIHVTTGSAGCQENHDPFLPWKPEYCAVRSSDYGYTRMKIHNGTHMHLQQVSDDQAGAIVDDFWIIKEKHGYEAWF